MFYVCKIFCRFCPFYFGKQERQSLQKILQQCKNDLLKKLLNFSVIFNHILDKTFPFCQKRGNFLFCSHRTGCGHRTVPLSLRSYIVEGDSSIGAPCMVGHEWRNKPRLAYFIDVYPCHPFSSQIVFLKYCKQKMQDQFPQKRQKSLKRRY